MRRDEGDLVARVRVINQAGHRLPSGVGFRRAWVELTVVDASGEVLWGSGVTDSQGVIVGPDGEPLASEFTGDWQKIQPHWAEISRQDQVQIYEERYINRYGDKMQLTTSFLGIGEVVKGNRLQPLGYYSDYLRRRLAEARTQEEREKWQSLLPESKLPPAPGSLDPDEDPDYRNGSGADTLTYRIPLRSLAGADVVRAKLCYQNIPPYYLRDRFSMGRGDQAQRLYYLVGHTETAGTAIADWKITIAEGEAPGPQL